MMDPSRRIFLHVVAAAVLLTGLNALKPIHADDPVYLRYGAEFAAHPLNPYGFQYGSPLSDSANATLVPPVFEYWLAAGTLLVGDNPTLLKLWLFPFALSFAAAISSLAGRFAPTLRIPLLWLIVMSPSILPSFNVMLDVPVLAIGMTALAVAMRALDRDSWILTLLAGVLAGLAIQTKYTGLVSMAAIVVWCVIHGRIVRGLVVAALALTLAVGWECFVASVQGDSHFMIHLRIRQGHFFTRCARLVLPLLSHVAGLGMATALLGMAAFGAKRRSIVLATLIAAASIAALALVPSQAPLIAGSDGKALLTASNLIYGLLAIVVWSAIIRVALQMARHAVTDEDWRLNVFLLVWMALELGGYFALSPFPAARRVAGFMIVFALLAGRLATLRGVAPRSATWAACYGAALALLVFVADYFDTRCGQNAAQIVARGPHTPAPGGTYWYFSWVGFGYYAEREGLTPLAVNGQMPRPGDLVAIDDFTAGMLPTLPDMHLRLVETIAMNDSFPVKATPGYCNGRTPLENCQGPRMRVMIYQVENQKIAMRTNRSNNESHARSCVTQADPLGVE
jgi:hypothetical protein